MSLNLSIKMILSDWVLKMQNFTNSKIERHNIRKIELQDTKKNKTLLVCSTPQGLRVKWLSETWTEKITLMRIMSGLKAREIRFINNKTLREIEVRRDNMKVLSMKLRLIITLLRIAITISMPDKLCTIKVRWVQLLRHRKLQNKRVRWQICSQNLKIVRVKRVDQRDMIWSWEILQVDNRLRLLKIQIK